MRAITALLAAALIAAASGASSLARDDAPALGLGSGAAATEEIAAGQVDHYRLDVVAGRTYVVETFAVARGSGEGSYLAVYDAAGRTVARGVPGGGDVDQTLELTADASGQLKVRVAGRGAWAGAYHLRALAARGEPGAAWDDHGEPDGWCSLGHALMVGGALTGNIAPTDPATISHYPDVDSYAVDLAGGQSYMITVDGLPADAPEGVVSIYAYVESTGFMAGGARSEAEGAPARMAITPGADARYCVGVSGSAAPAPWSGAYSVSAVELDNSVFLPAVKR